MRNKRVLPSDICVTDTRLPRLEELQAKYEGVEATDNNVEAAKNAQIVVLSVKPQDVRSILPQLRGQLANDDLLISIMAGVPIKTVADETCHAAVARCMPNTPGQVKEASLPHPILAFFHMANCCSIQTR